MKNKIRCLVLLLCAASLISLTACGQKNPPTDVSSPPAASSSPVKESSIMPNETAEAIFALAVKNDPAPATAVFGFGSDNEARMVLRGDAQDPYIQAGQEMAASFADMGADVSEEDVQLLVNATKTMLSKLDYSAEIKEMDREAGTAVVTSHVGYFEDDAIKNAMDGVLDEILADPDAAMGDESDLYSVLIHRFAEAMSAIEPAEDTRDFDTDFQVKTLSVNGQEKSVWMPADPSEFGADLSDNAMGDLSN